MSISSGASARRHAAIALALARRLDVPATACDVATMFASNVTSRDARYSRRLNQSIDSAAASNAKSAAAAAKNAVISVSRRSKKSLVLSA